MNELNASRVAQTLSAQFSKLGVEHKIKAAPIKDGDWRVDVQLGRDADGVLAPLPRDEPWGVHYSRLIDTTITALPQESNAPSQRGAEDCQPCGGASPTPASSAATITKGAGEREEAGTPYVAVTEGDVEDSSAGGESARCEHCEDSTGPEREADAGGAPSVSVGGSKPPCCNPTADVSPSNRCRGPAKTAVHPTHGGTSASRPLVKTCPICEGAERVEVDVYDGRDEAGPIYTPEERACDTCVGGQVELCPHCEAPADGHDTCCWPLEAIECGDCDHCRALWQEALGYAEAMRALIGHHMVGGVGVQLRADVFRDLCPGGKIYTHSGWVHGVEESRPDVTVSACRRLTSEEMAALQGVKL